jgi:hypothetical protein
MSAVLDQIPGLFDFLKKRLRLPDATTAVPEDALPPAEMRQGGMGLQPPRVALPAAEDVAAAAPTPQAPAIPMMRPRVALPVTDEAAGPAVRGVAENPEPPALRLRRVEPTIDYTPVRVDEATGRAINNEVRPRIADPLRYRMRRLDEMETEGAPSDRNGRLKSGGKGFIEGTRTGGLLGGIGGLIYGVAKPSWDEQITQERDVERERGLLQNVYGRQNAVQGIEEMDADIAIKRAKPRSDELERQAKEAKNERDDLLRVYNELPDFDPASTDPNIRAMVELATKHRIPLPKKDATSRNLQVVTRRKRDQTEEVGYVDPVKKTFVPLKDEQGEVVSRAPKPEKPLVPWKLSNGQTVHISQEAAASADAVRVRGTEADRKDAERIARDDSLRADGEASRLANDNRERVLKANKALAEYRRWKHEAANGKSPDVSKYGDDEAYRKAAYAEMMALLPELQSYPDIFNFNSNSEWPDAAPREVISIAEAMRQQRGKSRAQVVEEIRAKGYVPVP